MILYKKINEKNYYYDVRDAWVPQTERSYHAARKNDGWMSAVTVV